jgi:hypothetical protein
MVSLQGRRKSGIGQAQPADIRGQARPVGPLAITSDLHRDVENAHGTGDEILGNRRVNEAEYQLVVLG